MESETQAERYKLNSDEFHSTYFRVWWENLFHERFQRLYQENINYLN